MPVGSPSLPHARLRRGSPLPPRQGGPSSAGHLVAKCPPRPDGALLVDGLAARREVLARDLRRHAALHLGDQRQGRS
eukprot:11205305-Lingulodinium_polyedra.AAC.1